MSKIDYNKKSARENGWDPSWFGAEDFDQDLIDKIINFQKEMKVTADGMCGPGTFRLIYTDRLGDFEIDPKSEESKDRSLIFKGNEVDIEWDKVVRWIDDDGYNLSKTPKLDPDRDIKMFVTHWDVCLSAKSCVNVLNKRGIHVHFCIDNDGTIYQLADMASICWHAGGKYWNRDSIGVEISNAFYPKYQKNYVKKGFGERPIIKGSKVHGNSVEDHLGFYPVQIEALKALYKAVNRAAGVPLEAPLDQNGDYIYGVSKEAEKNNFRGFVSHHHLTRRKMDCCNINIEDLLKEIR